MLGTVLRHVKAGHGNGLSADCAPFSLGDSQHTLDIHAAFGAHDRFLNNLTVMPCNKFILKTCGNGQSSIGLEHMQPIHFVQGRFNHLYIVRQTFQCSKMKGEPVGLK
ncbi:MAG: hypothetical protein A3I66_00185 [Burkholderiales bacterium RIFCSPLOWO2_02_FULL_57_36]|nr:MAG: hypothetical protein A3I66_00185 [Burkholderiales bacterium RIFCSPLOWO2_02_FULL_57_36]